LSQSIPPAKMKTGPVKRHQNEELAENPWTERWRPR
jgi:hypothetical protein